MDNIPKPNNEYVIVHKQISNKPECTILLPVYNNKDDILNAINSVINQTFKNWELIIIDDCSTDGTYDVVDNFIRNNTMYNIRLIKNEKNQGTYVSLNEGLRIAKGEYIARIDSDDVYAKNMLDEHIKILNNHNNIIATQSQYVREGEEKKYGEITIVYRKRVINEIGYYDSVRFGADTEFMTRLKKKYGNPKIHRIDKVLYYAKQRPHSLTTSNATGINGEGGELRKIYLQNYTHWHKQCRFYIPYPLETRPFYAPERMLPDRKIEESIK
jgi:glycosyltransferase involved in cell wall biosynthesis